jgi:peptide deformylase
VKLQLRIYPNNILRTKCKPIKEVTDRHRRLAGAMHFNMKQWNGVGLAAPQVGRDINLIVINTVGHDDAGRKLTMYNPEIIFEGEAVNMQEGCLSFPNKFYSIERPGTVVVKYIDGQNNEQTEEFFGLTARAIIHEIDHLLGKVMIDYLGEDDG